MSRIIFTFILTTAYVCAQPTPSFRWIQQVAGSGSDSVIGTGTDAAGNVYIAGNTTSSDLPVKAAAQGHIASSGLFRIDGPGAAWTSLPLSSATSVSIDAKNSTTIYATSAGAALKSVDGGATWKTLTIAASQVLVIQVDPSNSSVVYAGSGGLGVFKSVDGGATWTPMNSGLDAVSLAKTQLAALRFWLDPFHPNVLFTLANGGARSSDGGATWNPDPTLKNLTSVWFDLATPNLVYATTYSTLLKSSDDGQTWTALAGASSQMGSIYSITSDPQRPGHLILGTPTEIYESTDDGATFPNRLILTHGFIIAPDWANGVLYTQATSVVKVSTDLKTVTPVGPAALATGNQIVVANGRVYVAVAASKDVFVTKFDRDGNVVYSTYFGGSADETASNMTVDAAGNVYVTGMTSSRDFPTTAGSYSPQPPMVPDTVFSNTSSFVVKFKTDGTLGYATYLSDGLSVPGGIAVDAAGGVVIAGTSGGDLPTTPGAYQTTFIRGQPGTCTIFCGFVQISNGFATKLDPSGAHLVFSTYVGAQATTGGPVALAADGSVYVGGGPVTISPSGSAIYHLDSAGATLLATANAPGSVTALAVAPSGSVYTTGVAQGVASFKASASAFQTAASPVPTLPQSGPGTYAYITEFDAPLKQVIASTLLGGYYGDIANGIAVDTSGNVLLGGYTAPLGFPTRTPLSNAFGPSTGFLSKLSGDLSTLLFSTYLGDNEVFAVQGVASSPDGDVVIAGTTGQASLGSTAVAHTYVNKIATGSRPALRIDAVLNAASMLSAPLSPGETIVIHGAGFGSDSQVTIGDSHVTPIAIDSQSLTAVVPANISATAVLIWVQSGGAITNIVAAPVAAAAPGLFSIDGSGFGQGYILNADGSRNSTSNPAKIGEAITIFATGVGPISFDGPYAVAAYTPQVYIDGFYAAGIAAVSGPVAGLPGDVYKLGIIIPNPAAGFPDLKNFVYPPLVQVVLRSNGVSSQSGLALAIAQ